MSNLSDNNSVPEVVRSFGEEWEAFDQSSVPEDELARMFDAYFSVFPWESVQPNAKGFDCGCGSGRWAALVAPRVGELLCIDPSEKALAVAQRRLASFANCVFHCAGVEDMPIENNSMDFGYSIGVLHHIPDTSRGIAACAAKLKPGAPFALYLYYAFDYRPAWFVAIWKASDAVRRVVSRCPFWLKRAVSEPIAAFVYWPLARLALVMEKLGINARNFPLYNYRNKSLYSMRTDSLDRFGTRLEHRFRKEQIRDMMLAAGFVRIRFSERDPYWCASGIKG